MESTKMPVERTQTGVPGLDEILFGGIPASNLVVISGDPGSGKTCLCLEYLYMGATKFGEAGVYISLEEPEEEIIKTGENFGWDIKKAMASRKLAIIAVELYDFDKLKNTIEDAVARLGAKRLVIDPGVIFRLYFERELDARKRILSLAKMLKRLGCTAIITNEISLDKTSSLFGLEEYVADGVVLLYHTKLEDRFVRSIGILKMRGTKISEKLHPIDLSQEGIKVMAKHELFEEVT
ncbi:MAG: ATPase domain-containing protein [Candidatus ainarchaeum sp.]|nr:ATPase domain-containing protein [Candidatus ainarchaeum sp.]